MSCLKLIKAILNMSFPIGFCHIIICIMGLAVTVKEGCISIWFHHGHSLNSLTDDQFYSKYQQFVFIFVIIFSYILHILLLVPTAKAYFMCAGCVIYLLHCHKERVMYLYNQYVKCNCLTFYFVCTE